MHTLYILKLDRENWFYVGITSSISKRIKLHNAGKVRSTKSRRPFKVIYTEDYGTKTEARRRELEIKKSWKLKKELIKNSLSAPSLSRLHQNVVMIVRYLCRFIGTNGFGNC